MESQVGSMRHLDCALEARQRPTPGVGCGAPAKPPIAIHRTSIAQFRIACVSSRQLTSALPRQGQALVVCHIQFLRLTNSLRRPFVFPHLNTLHFHIHSVRQVDLVTPHVGLGVGGFISKSMANGP